MELKVLQNLKKGPYVEFNSTGKHWDDSSLFLDEIIFGVFADSFRASNVDFNYFGPTSYNQTDLLKLSNDLQNFNSLLLQISDFESFIKIISCSGLGNQFLGELEYSEKVNLNARWSETLVALRKINVALLTLVQNFAKEDQVLWVFGI